MFNKIRRFYNQNYKKIIMIILIIIMIIVLIQVANYLAKNGLEKTSKTKSTNSSNTNLQTQSIISDTTIDEEKAKKNNDIIEQFVNFCNKKDIKSAYNILSDDCKQIIYNNNIDLFTNNYYNLIFTSTKSYTKENWMSTENMTTYKIQYTNDILADGKYKKEENFGDYITIIYDNKIPKLNISKFVTKEELNKTYEDDNIKIEIHTVYKYINSEIYKIKFTNKTDKEIKLYDINDNTKWYLQDENSSKYNVVESSLQNNLLILNANGEQDITVQFNKNYNSKKEVNKMLWENIKINDKNTSLEFNF